jgi:excinuclease ABC subunit A
MERRIIVRGARTNNLQGIDVVIPHGQLTVVTGVSGSGKSSLAFDTLYSEGQRLYVESMSAYARQFLERMRRPPVDSISGMLPSIALEQKNSVTNARSTVGTATEINDYLRLLYANVGHTVCPDCGVEAEKHSPQTAVRFLDSLPEGTRFLVLAPIAVESERRLGFLREHLASAGFRRVLVRGEVIDIAECRMPIADLKIGDRQSAIGNFLEVAVDRLAKSAERMSRAADSLEMAFRISSRGAVLQLLDGEGRPTERHHFFSGLVCRSCGREFREPQPEMFSFNSGIGACPKCEGFGKDATLDFDKIIPDPSKSLEDYAVALWSTPVLKMMTEWMVEKAQEDGIPTDVPFRDLTAEQKRWVIEGKEGRGDEDFVGIRGFFAWLESKKYKIQNRILIARYRRYVTCPTCGGTRLKPEAQHVKVGGKGITELLELPVPELRRFFETLQLPPAEEEAARTLLREIRGRIQYLDDVGLSYLTLGRETRTLSGGEAQRIHLASALGCSLTNTLYVLDEPTVGLHAADTHRLLAVLRALTGKGNTVVCVEHDPEIIEGADRVIDLGPGAGEHGGRVVFEGAIADLVGGTPSSPLPSGEGGKAAGGASASSPLLSGEGRVRDAGSSAAPVSGVPHPIPLPGGEGGKAVGGASAPRVVSLTADYLRQRAGKGDRTLLREAPKGHCVQKGPVPFSREPKQWLHVRGACQHNLKNLDVRVPLGVLACVTGVSGAGKSTLINTTLYAHYLRNRGEAGPEPGKCRSISGLGKVDEIILVDQKPLGRSARSNAATYTKAYDDIRRVFGATRRARTLGITASHFSFNIPGGRCEACQGMGTQTVDMQFLADVTVTCDVCGGHRFQKRVLEVTCRDRTVLDVLQMTVGEAMEFFEDTAPLVAKLRPLAEVGLGYLRLGQSTSTLSGGEAQRLKLAAYLSKVPPLPSSSGPLPLGEGRVRGAVAARSSTAAPHPRPLPRGEGGRVPLPKGEGGRVPLPKGEGEWRARRAGMHALLIFNEPTVGLHMADVQVLMGVLQRLVDEGHSVLIVEHNLDVIRQADWIIDLGPGGGDQGGELVAEGQPEAIMASGRSVTGRFLKERFGCRGS